MILKNSLRALMMTGAAFVAGLGIAQAHRAWLLPSTFTLSGESQWITVDGAISNDLFFPNHVPMRLGALEVTGPDGQPVKIENASTGKLRSVFDLHLTEQGTYKIADVGESYMVSWEEDGERNRRRGTLDELIDGGFAEKPGAELRQSVRRTETIVTLGAPTTTALEPAGVGLELAPVTHPSDIVTGEAVTFKLFADGAPASGLEVKLSRGEDRYRDDKSVATLTTDNNGLLTFTVEEAGAYWLQAGMRGETDVGGRKMGQSYTYVLTFEAVAL